MVVFLSLSPLLSFFYLSHTHKHFFPISFSFIFHSISVTFGTLALKLTRLEQLTECHNIYIATAIEIKIEIDVLCWCCPPVLKMFAKMKLHHCYGVGCFPIIYGFYFCVTIWMFATPTTTKNRKKPILLSVYNIPMMSIYIHTHSFCMSIYLTLYVQKYYKNFIMFLETWIISSEKMYVYCAIDMGDRTALQQQMGYLAILISPSEPYSLFLLLLPARPPNLNATACLFSLSKCVPQFFL